MRQLVMIVATGFDEVDYLTVFTRAADALRLPVDELPRLLERLVYQYPEAVCAVLEDMGADTFTRRQPVTDWFLDAGMAFPRGLCS